MTDSEIDALLLRARAGDDAAAGELLESHRARLRSMVAVRLDRRLSARVDPSDLVQEANRHDAKRVSRQFGLA